MIESSNQPLASLSALIDDLGATVAALEEPERQECLRRLLGESLCRHLGIYRIPDDFLLSVVIPVYNERDTIREILRRVQAVPIPKQVVLVQDADLEYDPAQYPQLIQPIVEGRADVVYGSRFIGETHRVLYFWHSLANQFLTTLSNVFTNLNLTDMEVCYKVFRREVIQGLALKSDRFGFEPEVTAKVARFQMPALEGRPARKCRVYEMP